MQRGRSGRRGRCIPDQAETYALLERLAGRPAQETQISAVFVGQDTVWKLKRAVRLPFLDFTPLAERRRTILRELELNGPAAPGLYRDAVAVVRRGGTLTLEEGNPPDALDWVLRMAPIPPGDILLDRVAAGFSPEFLDSLADAVAADHATRPVAAQPERGAVLHNIGGNARAALESGLPPDAIAIWKAAAEAAVHACAGLMAARAAAGLVRRAHGDLHLANLCVWQGRPVLFDALEFDEAMATIDLGYDLAFLLMDLDLRAGRPAANRVLNRILARTGDIAVVQLLPLFLSRRAMVRAHVTADRTYLDAALAYIRPGPGEVVAIGGLPGTGKSTLARAMAPALGPAPGALIVRGDEVRKRLAGVAPEDRLGPEGYTPAANARVRAALLDAIAAAGHHGLILDSTFLDPTLRAAVAKASGPRFRGIFLEAPIEELRRRVKTRTNDASDATVAVLDRLAASDPGPIEWVRTAS